MSGKRGSPARSPLLPRRPAERMESPAVERVKIAEHRVIKPQADDPNIVESRFAALEQQQTVDHAYLQQLAKAVRSLYEAQEWERLRRNQVDDQSITMDMNLRRELAATREELQGIYTKVPGMALQELQNFFVNGRGSEIIKHSDMVDEKILKVQQALDEMQGKGAKVESYLTQLHEERPKEGQAVVELVQKEVSQVRAMVSRFAPPHGDPKLVTHAHGIPFTQHMMDTLAEMEKKVLSHDVMQAHFSETLMQHAGYEQRIVAVESQILKVINHAEQQVNAATSSAVGLNLRGAFGAGIAGAAPQRGGCCGGTASGAWASWTGTGAGGAVPPGLPGAGAPGSSGDGGSELGAVLQRITGGNGQCHCVHVHELIMEVAKIKQGGSDPWPLRPPPAPCSQDLLSAQHAPRARGERRALPLTLKGPLGALNFKERALFDDKIAMQSDFSFNGLKGGMAWKGKVERYFISRIPILKTILEWAEAEELYEITEARFEEAVRDTLEPLQVQTLNAALWGFLSGSVSGTAETMFKGADSLNGLDAWRRLARYVDHGRAMRLETLRREVKLIHLKPIPSLEKVEEGVAEFENVLNEYIQVGGTPISAEEKKSDLLAVLPTELRETLLWRATDEGSFESFRDMVLTQCGKVLMNRKKLPVHAVDHERHANEQEGDDEGFTDLNSVEGIVAALSRAQRNGGRFQRRQRAADGGGGGAQRTGQPPKARQCPNCSETHEGRCPKPAVAVADRKCWTCGQKGCQSSRCPQKKSLKAIEDGRLEANAVGDGGLRAFYMVDDEGYQEVQRGKKSGRPMPTQATLGHFMSENTFKALATPSTSPSRASTTPTSTSTSTSRTGEPSGPLPASSASSGTVPPPPTPTATRRPRQTARRTGSGAALDSPLTSCSAKPIMDDNFARPVLHDCSPLDTMSDPAPAAKPAVRSNGPKNAFPDHCSRRHFGKIDEAILVGIAEAQHVADELEAEAQQATDQASVLIIEEEDEGMIGAATEEVTIRAAADSAAVDNVIHPSELPCDASPEPNTTGRHFVGANNARIEKFGTCKTKLESEHGAVGCEWQLADVSRPLHSVSKITGPEYGPPKQDVLFTNRKCVVVPPGIVDEILKRVTPVTEYKRTGNLYLGEFKMTSFARQGQKA